MRYLLRRRHAGGGDGSGQTTTGGTGGRPGRTLRPTLLLLAPVHAYVRIICAASLFYVLAVR